MLALVLVMLLCVAVGAGVVGFVLVEARREGRGGFWTEEGEELIAGARRTSEKVVTRGEQLATSATARAQSLRTRPARPGTQSNAQSDSGAKAPVRDRSAEAEADSAKDADAHDYRAAS